jgi:polyisoprenoid-binding protein YceI
MLSLFLFSQLQSAIAAPQDVAFLSNKGVLYVQVYKAATLAADLSHDHAIQAVGWSGKGTWDSEDYSSCNISIAVPVNNLQVDNPEIRKMAGINGTISESMRMDVKKHMLSDIQLDAEKYPMISFQSTSCEGSGDSMTLKGNFTMHGTTNAISVPITVSNDTGLSLKGSFPVKATDYGIEPYSAMFGAVGNKDGMKITFDLVAAGK